MRKQHFIFLVSNLMRYLLAMAGLVLSSGIKAQNVHSSRIVINLDKDWSFTKDAYQPNQSKYNQKVTWQPINLPHTWNVSDVVDDKPGYYRGVCWYSNSFAINEALQSKELYLHFEGANQQSEVYVNGHKADSHTGGYTAFDILVSRYVRRGKNVRNELLVKAEYPSRKPFMPTADT